VISFAGGPVRFTKKEETTVNILKDTVAVSTDAV